MLSSIRRMLDAFEENQISYCHWKSNEHLEPALNGDTDLDMLFLPEQRDKLDAILNQCGLKRFRAMPLMQYNAIEDYIGFDIETAKIWHLHLHYRMTLGEKHLKGYTVTPWGQKIIDARIRDNTGIYTSCPEDEMLLFLVRNAMKLRWRDFGKKIGKSDLREWEWLQNKVVREKLLVRAKEFFTDKLSDYIIGLTDMKLKNKNQLLKLQRALRKELKIYTGYSRVNSYLTRTKREVYWFVGAVFRRLGLNGNKPNRRISPAGGCAVAILGCDGAGKSTTLSYIRKEFSKKIDVKCVYLGSGDGSSSLIRKPMKYVAKKVGGKGVGKAVEKEYVQSQEAEKQVSLKARLYSFAKIVWALTLADEKKKKLRQITKARNAGMLVLIDRYPQIEVPGICDGPLLTKYLSREKGMLYYLAKKEYDIYSMSKENLLDLAIKLTVPTEVAMERKPEMTAEKLNEKKKTVMMLEVAHRECIIDTSVDKIESCGKVMNEIWQVI